MTVEMERKEQMFADGFYMCYSSPELPDYISSCLLRIPTWRCKRHLKLNTWKTVTLFLPPILYPPPSHPRLRQWYHLVIHGGKPGIILFLSLPTLNPFISRIDSSCKIGTDEPLP